MRKPLSATYRIQLHAEFNFDAAAGIAEYLSELGISHAYMSPYLQTTPGSTHGYDVADFKSVNKELGGAEAQERFCKRLGENGLGQIVDIVPNHMSLTQNNPYWRDVLENGPESRYASYFDMDWETGEARMRNKVLLPILENQYGVVLKNRGVQLERKGIRFEVTHAGNCLPVAPASMAGFLASAARILRSDKLAFFADCFARLVHQDSNDSMAVFRLQRDKNVLLRLLDDYIAEDAKALDAIDEAIAAINNDPDALDDFLQKQHYRLAYWRAADQDLGYRRFFDVNTLIGMRVEREHVFLETHELVLDWLRRGVLDGVRADHADGLRDPQRYFERLREHAPDAWIVAEKIVARNETLPPSWPVAGTTGYEFLNLINGLFASPDGLTSLDAFYAELLGQSTDYPALVHDKKIAVTAEGLGSDVNWLTSIFVEICEADPDHRDHTRAHIRHAIREVAACFHVYRTYVSPERDEISEIDAAVIQTAIDVGATYRPDIDRGLYDFIGDVLLLRKRGELESEFLLRFQQFTSPVMAKGLEDTALYCYNRLVGLNDVGSNLANPIVTIDDFHRSCAYNQHHQPQTMLTLTTHDTKRGEDVRARLMVLSEMPLEFAQVTRQWFAMNAGHRKDNIPDPNTEYLYYQTLIGAWPIGEERAIAYMLKATREAKQQTSWVHNNTAFENGMQAFIKATLNDKEFCEVVTSFVEGIKNAGYVNSLTQTLVKCTSPGVPDLYQGSELWDLRLVDPDNRTPVDYECRRRLLREMQRLSIEQIVTRMDEGMPKLFVIQRALQVRRERPVNFGVSGEYTPILASGEKAKHVFAFLRGKNVAVVVPRLSSRVQDWQKTEISLPAGTWTNAFTGAELQGGTLTIAPFFSEFPVALLTKKD